MAIKLRLLLGQHGMPSKYRGEDVSCNMATLKEKSACLNAYEVCVLNFIPSLCLLPCFIIVHAF
jgi:hypothetical protein